MRIQRLVALILAVALSGSQARPQTMSAAPPRPAFGSSYPDIKKPHFHRNWPGAKTYEQQRELMLGIFRSKYGGQGSRNLLKDLAGHGEVDLSIPGVAKNLLLATADNSNVARGAMRTHLYVAQMANDPRFQILSLNETVKTPLGNSDKDIRYLNLTSRTTGRIEVKNVNLDSQRRNMRAYRLQMDKMHNEYLRTGELQTFANRYEVALELKVHAAQRGIPVYEKVVTGEKSGTIPGVTRMESVLDDLNRRHFAVGQARTFGGGTSTALGLLLIYQTLPQTMHDVRDLIDPENRDKQHMLRALRGTTLSSSGAAMTVAGASTLATLVVTNAKALEILVATGRWSGAAATVTFLVAEGFVIWQYNAGHLTSREFWGHEAGLVGGVGGVLGGTWVGMKLGALIGTPFGPEGTAVGTIIGGIVGGIGGGFAGSQVGVYGASRWYELQDEHQQQELREFVFALYGLSSP
jgi:hypothetical protein